VLLFCAGPKIDPEELTGEDSILRDHQFGLVVAIGRYHETFRVNFSHRYYEARERQLLGYHSVSQFSLSF
jgi:hypothetical protein